LKQPQYAPLSLEEMVAQIWLGQKGYMDAIPLDKLADFADSFVSQLRASKATPLESIRTAKVISPETEAVLTQIADEVKKMMA
jgi:F-type H+-transporting ATPase subunit alpha